jgi:hypothetical protein
MRRLVDLAQPIIEGRGKHADWDMVQLLAWHGRSDYTPDMANATIFFPAEYRRN